MRPLGVAGALSVALLAACGTSKGSGADDEAIAGAGGADGSGGSKTSLGGEGGSISEAGFGPIAPGGEANAAGSPAEGGGSNPGGGGIIQALGAALGNSAIALQGADTNAFWPEPATDDNDEWLVTVLGAYDGEMDDGAASGHYLVTQPTGASLDFELEADVSAASYRAFVGPSWLTIYLKKAGASGFRVDVTCSDVEVNATGTGTAAVIVGQDTGDTTSGSLFCVAAEGPSPQPFSQPATSFEVEADEEGYAVMPYFEVTVIAGTSGQAGSASAKAKVHMELTALP
jgi:hypothetical protein